jgi:hypothetical protein
MSWVIDTVKHLVGGDSTLALLVLFLMILMVPFGIVAAYKLFF